MITDERLTEITGTIGADYGYKDVEARFVAFRDFKVKWRRSYTWISLDVSDYLQDAPEEVVESTLRTIFMRIKGETCDYDDVVTDFVLDPRFARVNRPKYIRRGRFFPDERADECMDRLVRKGLVPDDGAVSIQCRVGEFSERRCPVSSSVLMRTIVMNDGALDRAERSPDFRDALDFVVYTHYLHIMAGFPNDFSWDMVVSKYPEAEHMRVECNKLGLRMA